MGKKRRYNANSRPVKRRTDRPPEAPRAAPEIREKKVPTRYGQMFIILEDESKNTFEYKDGAWVPHGVHIADYRLDGQVKELSQKINRMTRYEVRSPLPIAT